LGSTKKVKRKTHISSSSVLPSFVVVLRSDT
jgi:hypothetical protein